MSMDDVARQAGVSKATIYRWWPSKERLALDALATEWAASHRPLGSRHRQPARCPAGAVPALGSPAESQALCPRRSRSGRRSADGPRVRRAVPSSTSSSRAVSRPASCSSGPASRDEIAAGHGPRAHPRPVVRPDLPPPAARSRPADRAVRPAGHRPRHRRDFRTHQHPLERNPDEHSRPLSVDEASRLAVTATAADLEDWARSVAVHGQVSLDDLVDVLDVLRADSVPQHSSPRIRPRACRSQPASTQPPTREAPRSNTSVPAPQIGDTKVSALGLGGMPMSIEGRPEESRSIATIHAALDAGVTLIDTADAYHLGADEVGHNETLIAQALASYGADTSEVLVATKGGHLRPGDGSWTLNGSPEHLRQACEASLRRLGVEAIGLYQFHRPDPTVPVRGLDRRDPRPARRGQDPDGRHLQRQPRPDPAGATRSWAAGWSRCRTSSPRPSAPASPSSGSATSSASPSCPGARWAASRTPPTSAPSYRAFAQVADELDASPQQVTLAWMLAKSPVVIPIPGSSRPGDHPRLGRRRRPRGSPPSR